jgi:hypothetical protein
VCVCPRVCVRVCVCPRCSCVDIGVTPTRVSWLQWRDTRFFAAFVTPWLEPLRLLVRIRWVPAF